jgi:DNA-directed RNA polymerase, mitochondrial
LAQIMWRQIDRTVVKAREAMNWLQQVSRLASSEDLPITWTTPSGFVVLQQYRESRSRRVETKLGEGIVKLSIAEDTSRLNRRRQRSGCSPNYIHSLDSAMMSLVTCKMKTQGIHHFAMIHDSYGVHATSVDKLSKCLRLVCVEMFQEDLLKKFGSEIFAMLSTKNQKKFPKLPNKGTLELEKVIESEYFFA